MLYSIFFVINVIVSFALITIVLIHRGKGSEVGAAFSGASSSLSVFGAKGPDSFLIKLVSALAFLFFVNALAMIYVADRDFVDDSVIEQFDVEGMTIDPGFEEEAEAPVNDDADARDLQNMDNEAPAVEDAERSLAPEIPN